MGGGAVRYDGLAGLFLDQRTSIVSGKDKLQRRKVVVGEKGATALRSGYARARYSSGSVVNSNG
jgi:hypothetical protein